MGITPLHRYYGPVRLPTGAILEVMHSLKMLGSTHPIGSLRFLSFLSMRAVSLYPGGSDKWWSDLCSFIDVRLQDLRNLGHPQLV